MQRNALTLQGEDGGKSPNGENFRFFEIFFPISSCFFYLGVVYSFYKRVITVLLGSKMQSLVPPKSANGEDLKEGAEKDALPW